MTSISPTLFWTVFASWLVVMVLLVLSLRTNAKLLRTNGELQRMADQMLRRIETGEW